MPQMNVLLHCTKTYDKPNKCSGGFGLQNAMFENKFIYQQIFDVEDCNDLVHIVSIRIHNLKHTLYKHQYFKHKQITFHSVGCSLYHFIKYQFRKAFQFIIQK